ncbi:MAG TPA: hypothetical protein VM285_08300 [Polyangia bacterium]|nr:hypothetical protein [Polyangia bacterium]
MNEETTRAVAVVGVNQGGIEITNVEELRMLATTVIQAKLAPPGIETVAQALIAIEVGLEAGFRPLQGLRAVAVINNRPTWLGKAALALVRQRGALKHSPTRKYTGTFDVSKSKLARYGDDYRCIVTVWRAGDPEPHDFEYSVDDAKTAGLWNPSNDRKPWATAPKRMLYWRAIGMAMDELFSDVLLGLPLAEVAEDYGDERRGFENAKDVTPATPEEAADPILAHFEEAEAAGETDGDVSDIVLEESHEAPLSMQLEPSAVLRTKEPDPKPKPNRKRTRKEADARTPVKTVADEVLGDQDADTSRASIHEETAPIEDEDPPLEESGPCDHEWKMVGNPTSDDEPTLACTLCGLTDDQAQAELDL